VCDSPGLGRDARRLALLHRHLLLGLLVGILRTGLRLSLRRQSAFLCREPLGPDLKIARRISLLVEIVPRTLGFRLSAMSEPQNARHRTPAARQIQKEGSGTVGPRAGLSECQGQARLCASLPSDRMPFGSSIWHLLELLGEEALLQVGRRFGVAALLCPEEHLVAVQLFHAVHAGDDDRDSANRTAHIPLHLSQIDLVGCAQRLEQRRIPSGCEFDPCW
jgi:hypothetical protein